VQGVLLRPARGELVRDVRNGVALLRLMDVVEPGLVNWPRASVRPGASRVKAVENCNMAVNLGRGMDFALGGVSGLDLADAPAGGRASLSFLWQLARYHVLKQLSGLAFDGFAPTEGDVLAWANERVADEVAKAGLDGAAARVPSWKDAELATGLWLLCLLQAVRPGCVDWAAVADGGTPAEQEANAQYVLAVARAVGVPQPLCAWQDIVAVKPRSLLLLVASVYVLDASVKRLAEGDDDDDDEDEEDDE
jgi:hypothetical protein